MATLLEIPIIASEWQDFSVQINNHDCFFVVKYSRLIQRWSFNLSVDGVERIHGRLMVPESDLVKGYFLDIGEIKTIFWNTDNDGAEPNFEGFPSGTFRLIAVVP
jgi:hypothetical protein